MKFAFVRYVPVRLADSLRTGKRILRRTRYRIGQRLDPVTFSQRDLVKGFLELGLTSGSNVCMYSSMSRLGQIEGGASTVIAALEEVVGGEGCLAMPAFPLIGTGLNYLQRGQVFDLRNTPSAMGAITETFRKMPGVLRSLHPTHSVSARGSRACALTEGHEDCRTPFGFGSPFVKMIEMNTDMVAFGVGVQNFTLYHTFEDLCGDSFPYSVYLNRIFSVDCIDEEGKRRVVSTLVHDPAVSQNRIDNNPEIEAEMRRLLLGGGKMRTAKVGKGQIFGIKAPDLISELYRFLQLGFTIYGRTRPTIREELPRQ